MPHGKNDQDSVLQNNGASNQLIGYHTSDVCGPMSVEARGGYHYVLTLTDDLNILLHDLIVGTLSFGHEFGTHLRKCGIVSQLTPPGTPQRNGVSEHRNRTLLDMVRSMMSLTDLPLSFWGYALETATFTLNRAPSKSVETTPYELWFGKKPKLSFLKVWGCDAYVKKLQPEKLEPKSEKCVFIGYPKETIGYTFYLIKFHFPPT